MSENPPFKRWYDRDPALSRAMEQLRTAPDKYQAQVALNIIKIIVEHQMEDDACGAPEDMLAAGMQQTDPARCRRWYDVHEALRSAMQLLCDCPDDLQQRVIPSVARMIETTLAEKIPD